MIVQCLICNASNPIEDINFEEGIITCSYCQTVIQFSDLGLDAYKSKFLHQSPPNRIRVNHTNSGVKIIIPISTGQQREAWHPIMIATFPLTLILAQGFFYFLAKNYLTQTGSEPLWLVSLCFLPVSSLVAVFALIIIGLFTNLHSSHINLQNHLLHVPKSAMIPKHNTLSVNNIRQLYVTANQIGAQAGQQDWYSLYALMENGSRRPIFIPFKQLESALYVEALLEIKLGIFNLPVLGEAEAAPAGVAFTAKEETGSPLCFACTAPLMLSTQHRKQGYVICAACQTITLLYKQGQQDLILGTPDPQETDFELFINNEFAIVKRRESEETVLMLKGKRVMQCTNITVQHKQITQLSIRKTTDGKTIKELLSGNTFEPVAEALSISNSTADDEPLEPAQLLLSNFQFTIFGNIDNVFVPLFISVESIAEAAYLALSLNAYLEIND